MIYGLVALVFIIVGFLIYRKSDSWGDWKETTGLFLLGIGIVSFIIWAVFLGVFQINKDLDFQANVVARENIIYAIEHYENINDDIGLNSTKYDLLKKAMDFNQSLIVQQERTKSVFYMWFCNPDYNTMEPIDYAPLMESRQD